MILTIENHYKEYISLSHHKKISDWLLQPSLPIYDLDNNYGDFMRK